MFPNLHLLRWTLHKLINHITLKKTKKYSGQLWLGAFKNIEEMEHSLKNSPWSLPNKDRAPPFPNLEWEEYAKKISLQKK